MSYPSTVQAITIARYGGPEVIEKTVISFPKVEPHHVVIKMLYLGVNFIDTYERRGIYPVSGFPYVLGNEGAGTIVGLPTDPEVLNDPDYQLRGYSIGSRVVVEYCNAYSEYISLPWLKVHHIPFSVPTLTAVSTFVQGLTAISFMEEAYNVQQGDIILIHTVAGGLGLLLSQYAKSRGAVVIGTTSTREKATIAEANGVDHVILYKEEDTVGRVLQLTHNEGAHAIYDGVGKDTFESNFLMIRRKGTIVSVGNASGPVPPFAPLKLVHKNIKLIRPSMRNYTHTPAEARHYSDKLFECLFRGTLHAWIHHVYPFTADGIQQAHRDLASGCTTGKLIIKI